MRRGHIGLQAIAGLRLLLDRGCISRVQLVALLDLVGAKGGATCASIETAIEPATVQAAVWQPG